MPTTRAGMLVQTSAVAFAVNAAVFVPLVYWCRADQAPKEPSAPPPPVPKTKPVDWSGSQHDSDKVPVQVVTLADGHAFFVVGTDTAAWPPLVWLFDPASGKWARQPGELPPVVR